MTGLDAVTFHRVRLLMIVRTAAARLVRTGTLNGRLHVLACLTGLMASASIAPADEAAARPNIILAMADDQGYGDVGYYGHPVLKTPVLDEMSRSGLRFDHFYAAHPVCSPTRASVMTGRHPNRMACFSWGHTLRPEEITIAEALRQSGYATGHFGKWHLGSCHPEDEVSPGKSGFEQWVSSPNFYENNPLLAKNGRVIETEGESSMVTVESALEFIRDQVKQEKPFLAVIWFGNPHTPHQALPHLRELYPDSTPAEQNYYGEITGIDRAMGHLRKELDALGIREDTLLWYTSDNGPQGRSPGSSGGLRGAKASLWEGGIRVPGIIEWPRKIRQARVTQVPAITSDIFPTVLAAAGVQRESTRPLDGIDLMPLIEGEVQQREQPLGFWVYQAAGIRTPSRELLLAQRQGADETGRVIPERTEASLMKTTFREDELPGHAAWRDGSWKLHRIPRRNGMVSWELYHLDEDPAESQDLSQQHPERVAAMGEQLAAWQRSVIRSLNGDDYK